MMVGQNFEGVANVDFTVVAASPLTWETAADWDGATSEAGVVHEAWGDLPGDGTVQIGFPSYDMFGGGGLVSYWPMDEDSGSTVTDRAGSNDGALNGSASFGTTSLHGMTGVDLPGADGDYISVPDAASLDISDQYTLAIVMSFDSQDNFNSLFGKSDSSNYVAYELRQVSGQLEWGFFNGSWYRITGASTISNSTLYLIVGTYNAGDLTLYLNGSSDASTASFPTSAPTGSGEVDIGRYAYGNSNAIDGQYHMARLYNRELTSTQVQTLYDTLTGGSLTTATKSFGSNRQPDLQNLSYSLNGQSITLDVIGSPGTASEEIVSQALDGSTSYTLTWGSGHTDFRVKLNLSTTNEFQTPTVSRVEVF